MVVFWCPEVGTISNPTSSFLNQQVGTNSDVGSPLRTGHVRFGSSCHVFLVSRWACGPSVEFEWTSIADEPVPRRISFQKLHSFALPCRLIQTVARLSNLRAHTKTLLERWRRKQWTTTISALTYSIPALLFLPCGERTSAAWEMHACGDMARRIQRG
jgi:hypothetical protein